MERMKITFSIENVNLIFDNKSKKRKCCSTKKWGLISTAKSRRYKFYYISLFDVHEMYQKDMAYSIVAIITFL